MNGVLWCRLDVFRFCKICRVCRAKPPSASRSAQNAAVASGRYVEQELTVPKTLFDEKLQELLVKDETIQVS